MDKLEAFFNGDVYNPYSPGNYGRNISSLLDADPNTNPGGSLVTSSEDDAISNLAKDLDMKLDSTTKDYLTEFYLNERSNENAWMRQMDASNTQYQRAVEDLKKAGLNPFLAISSLSGASSPSSSGQGVQGGLFTTSKNSKRSAAVSALGILGIIAAAVVRAMA